ncbi:MAG: alpha/beta hydrolase [Granulosicoccaceae bacterium]
MISFDSAQRYFSHAYMLRETIPDFHAEVERWESLGQTLEEDLVDYKWSSETLRYGEHPRQDLQLYRAQAGATGKGLAVFIHGGFWRMMARAQSHFMARPYLEAGWDCAVLEYRLMPEFRLSELVDDTAAALHLLHSLDNWPKRMLSGHSAGAHLAWHGGLAARAAGASGTQDSLLLISPVFDIFAVQSTPIITELDMPMDEAAKWSCYHGFANADQAVQLAVGEDETEDFKRQAYMGSQMMGRGEQQNIALLGGCNHLSVVTQIATEQAVFDALHRPLGFYD